MFQMPPIGVIVVIIGLMYLWRRPDALRTQWEADARAQRAVIPPDRVIERHLRHLYTLFAASCRSMPEMKGHYQALLDGMWRHLAGCTTHTQFVGTLAYVRDRWPKPRLDVTAAELDNTLEQVASQVNLWQQAQSESRSPSRYSYP